MAWMWSAPPRNVFEHLALSWWTDETSDGPQEAGPGWQNWATGTGLGRYSSWNSAFCLWLCGGSPGFTLLLSSTLPHLPDHGGLCPLSWAQINPSTLGVIPTVMEKVTDASIEFRLFSYQCVFIYLTKPCFELLKTWRLLFSSQAWRQFPDFLCGRESQEDRLSYWEEDFETGRRSWDLWGQAWEKRIALMEAVRICRALWVFLMLLVCPGMRGNYLRLSSEATGNQYADKSPDFTHDQKWLVFIPAWVDLNRILRSKAKLALKTDWIYVTKFKSKSQNGPLGFKLLKLVPNNTIKLFRGI